MDNTDYDSCRKMWDYYKIKYKEFDIDTSRIKYNKGRGSWKYRYKGNVMDLSGDCMFNFNDEKIDSFTKNIELHDNTKKRLDVCKKHHHSEENCVLLPKNGGLNNLKGSIYYRVQSNGYVVKKGKAPSNMYDRPDTFVYYLNNYFEHRHDLFTLETAGEFIGNSVFSYAINTFNFKKLWIFLEGFETIEEFCRVFFMVDEDFVERMIEEGQMPINTDDNLNRYIDLAMEFWRISNKSVTI